MTDDDAIGKAEVVRQVVDRHYELVLADNQLGPYFAGVDLARLKRRQRRPLTQLVSGPVSHNGRSLRDAHHGLRITREHYERWSTYLAGAIWESGAGVDLLMRLSGALAELEAEVVDGAVTTGKAAAPPGHSTELGLVVQAHQDNGHGVLPPRGLQERS